MITLLHAYDSKRFTIKASLPGDAYSETLIRDRISLLTYYSCRGRHTISNLLYLILNVMNK